MEIFYDKNINQGLIKTKNVAVIGYGSQGRAHALNLHNSGVNVTVGLKKTSSTVQQVLNDGLKVKTVEDAVKDADLVMILAPDELQADLYNNSINPNLKNGATLAFAHGLNVHFSLIVPPANVDVIMIAPKGPGYKVREEYQKGSGVPCLVAVHQNCTGGALDLALSYASAIGGGRLGVIQTTFKEECETDLFGEQAVLCGGLAELIKAGFDTLVNAGYSPEMAYFECVHEVKLIVDLIYEGGLEKMNNFISNTAEYGEYISGKRVIDRQTVRNNMNNVLEDIQNGEFVSRFISEYKSGSPRLQTERNLLSQSLMEKVGKKLRSSMIFKATN